MSDTEETPENIWRDDLFGRAKEAELLIGYLESVADRPSRREDAKGYTIAIDGRYGEGKTFFLKRLARQLALNHPVAFVDAWADDLADEPLTALAATLKKALDPLITESSDVRSKFENVVEKSGKIAKLVGLGLVKKGVGLALTAGVADALGDVITGADKEVGEALKESTKSAGTEAVDGAVNAFKSVAPGKLMDKRIAAFEEGQNALREMKESLAELVAALEDEDLHRPIFIIIDELDRCRPTYAVKLLEEIKHLFDVAGIVFILGLHGDQLAHSVSAAYGVGFDSKAYLRRFFNRQYQIIQPDLTALIEHLAVDMGLMNAPASMYRIATDRQGPIDVALPNMVSRYMELYGLSARNAFEVMDILQTCFALTGRYGLHMHYILPLIAGHVLGLPSGTLPKAATKPSWRLLVYTDVFGRSGDEIEPDDLAQRFQDACGVGYDEMMRMMREEPVPVITKVVFEDGFGRTLPPGAFTVRSYPRLLTTVGRFKNPDLNNQ